MSAELQDPRFTDETAAREALEKNRLAAWSSLPALRQY